MYYLDNRQHKTPHIHIKYQEEEAVISIPDGQLLEGILKLNKMKLSGKTFKVIALCHPRQAQRLGASSASWYDLHKHWVNQKKI
jgi:hypothetical protein